MEENSDSEPFLQDGESKNDKKELEVHTTSEEIKTQRKIDQENRKKEDERLMETKRKIKFAEV